MTTVFGDHSRAIDERSNVKLSLVLSLIVFVVAALGAWSGVQIAIVELRGSLSLINERLATQKEKVEDHERRLRLLEEIRSQTDRRLNALEGYVEAAKERRR